MRRKLGMALLLAACCCTAQATNWLQLQGSEAPDAPAVRYFGFLQSTYPCR